MRAASGILLAATTKDNLTLREAEAGFAAIVLGDIIVFIAFLAPLLLDARDQPWKRDCLKIGFVTAILVVLVGFLVLGVLRMIPDTLKSRNLAGFVEIAVFVIYTLNTLGLGSAIARTGGPSASFFAPLIPAQLSGILLLQGQRNAIAAEAREWIALGYLVVASAAMIASHLWRAQLMWWLEPNAALNEVFEFNSLTLLFTVLGLGVSFLSYWLPRTGTWNNFTARFSQSFGAGR